MSFLAGCVKSIVWVGGGENQRNKTVSSSGYSATAQCTGKPHSYLEPISQSLHRTIGVVYRTGEKIEEGVAIGEKINQNHAENTAQTYLDRIRNRMHEPIEGLSRIKPQALNKRERGSQTKSSRTFQNRNLESQIQILFS